MKAFRARKRKPGKRSPSTSGSGTRSKQPEQNTQLNALVVEALNRYKVLDAYKRDTLLLVETIQYSLRSLTAMHNALDVMFSGTEIPSNITSIWKKHTEKKRSTGSVR